MRIGRETDAYYASFNKQEGGKRIGSKRTSLIKSLKQNALHQMSEKEAARLNRNPCFELCERKGLTLTHILFKSTYHNVTDRNIKIILL